MSPLSRGAASMACCLALAASALGCGGLAAGGEGPLIGTGEVTALDELLETLIADVSAQPQEDRRFSRYLLLTPRDRDGFWPGELSETDVQDGGVATDRRTVGKLINSLSLQPGIVLPVPVGLGRILRLDLRDYGWELPLDDADSSEDHWDALAAVAALAVEIQGPRADLLKALTRARIPFLFAQDFLATASDGDLYYSLLGVPDTLLELQRRLNQGVMTEYRAGFSTSGLSTTKRAVSRQAPEAGGLGYWQAFDFDAGRDDAVFSSPLQLEPDGTELIYRLPNGLHGFFLADRAGARVGYSTVGTITDPAQPDRLLRNAASCFACHNGGLIPFRDEVRSRLASGATPDGASDPERTRVLSTYPDPPVMDRLVNEWNTAYESAAEQAGQAPGSPDPITLSYLRFLSGYVTVDVAAGELFVSPVELEAALLTLDPSLAALGDAAGVVDRSAYRTVYRQTLCRLYEDKNNRPAACP